MLSYPGNPDGWKVNLIFYYLDVPNWLDLLDTGVSSKTGCSSDILKVIARHSRNFCQMFLNIIRMGLLKVVFSWDGDDLAFVIILQITKKQGFNLCRKYIFGKMTRVGGWG